MAVVGAGVLAAASQSISAQPAANASGGADPARVCRAAIAALMGRDPAIIKVVRSAGGVVDTRYVRPTDGTVWKNRCRISGNRVEWAAYQGGALGRWRSEDVITYSVSGGRIRVVGSSYGEQMFNEIYTVR
ncbi:hypothetical protein [Caulobacter radicis]|uniref:hypothetical protein n=1 Tax=Caulobacter radicis TaxID=2172650 RepID=UPI001057F3FA|nr:hypothetical protein [Caulobacter radicis]